MQDKKTFMLVCLSMVVVQLGFGAYGVVVTKYAKKNNADPLIFCLFRDGLCFPVMIACSFIFEKGLIIPNKRELPVFLALGLFGMAVSQCCYILGVYFVSADIASMFQPLAAVWVTVLAIVTRLEPIPDLKTQVGFSKAAGVFVAVIGAVSTAYGCYMKKNIKRNINLSKVDQGNSVNEMYGYVALTANTFFTGVYMIIQKNFIFTNKHSRFQHQPVNVTAWSYFFGFIFISIASSYYLDQPEKFYSVNKDSAVPLCYAVFITSTLCYLLTSWSNMKIESTLVSAFWPLQVFFCVIIAYFILGETLSQLEIYGGFLMISALFIVLWSNYQASNISNNKLVIVKVIK